MPSSDRDIIATPAEAPLPAALIAKVCTAVDADAACLTAIFMRLHQHPAIACTKTRTLTRSGTLVAPFGVNH
ncbi:MAG: hypothetical protein H7306_26900 [Bacteriovorax sp.]|nr:hypothetical protein [Rhizobacter sp.]